MKEMILIHAIATDFKCCRDQSGLCPIQPLRAGLSHLERVTIDSASYVGRRTEGGAAQRALQLGLHTAVYLFPKQAF
jgi:hypothetical protein